MQRSMQRWSGLLLGVSLVLAGCNKRSDDTTALMEAAVNRPIVAVVPVIDHSHSNLNWNVSHELSQAVRQRLAQKNHLYLLNEETFASGAKKALTSHDPFELDTSWIKKSFPQNEFVVFMELMEHNELPVSTGQNSQDVPAELNIAVRVRVFDLRGKTPHLILQEIVEQSHHIPWQFTKTHFNQVPFGDETFDVSPLGIAHDKLCKELASRIEDYILLSGHQ